MFARRRSMCQSKEVITKDNVTVGVDAVVYFRVINAPKAVLRDDELHLRYQPVCRAALRDVTGNIDAGRPACQARRAQPADQRDCRC